MSRYQSIRLPVSFAMLAMAFVASSVAAAPPDWVMRQGSIDWALTQQQPDDQQRSHPVILRRNRRSSGAA
jgi:hypothetical protein